MLSAQTTAFPLDRLRYTVRCSGRLPPSNGWPVRGHLQSMPQPPVHAFKPCYMV